MQADENTGGGDIGNDLSRHFAHVRALTCNLTASLSDADATVQSMEDASPAKWHLAHTTWFFETFLLRDHLDGYEPFDPDYHFLFNSYYEAEGERHARTRRGMITRPSLDEILAYRAHVDAAMQPLCERGGEVGDLVTLGLHHEQQHQELLMTDIKHMFAQNPLMPAMWARDSDRYRSAHRDLEWVEGTTGVVSIGHEGGGFAFDCEGPRHEVILTPHALANRTVTNAEWAEFIADGGYENPAHWLSDGWSWVQENGIGAPLYRTQDKRGQWRWFTLTGEHPVDAYAPVTHISLYEADAYASWAGARLPTEAEWESAAANASPDNGTFLDGHNPVRPYGARPDDIGLCQMFGDVWEWTGSAYRPYPGFRAADGAVGEYNGKFMSGQFVLKGGSCATPEDHIRASYRNFFYPHQRWQFTGLRLAKDL